MKLNKFKVLIFNNIQPIVVQAELQEEAQAYAFANWGSKVEKILDRDFVFLDVAGPAKATTKGNRFVLKTEYGTEMSFHFKPELLDEIIKALLTAEDNEFVNFSIVQCIKFKLILDTRILENLRGFIGANWDDLSAMRNEAISPSQTLLNRETNDPYGSN